MQKMYHTSQSNPDKQVIEEVKQGLLDRQTALLPTDSVYGIACAVLPDNDAYEAIYRIKNRPSAMKLPWLIADVEQLDVYGRDIPAWAYRLADEFWPGALTLIVKATEEVPDSYRAPDGTVALRMPDSEFIRDLIRQMKCPLAATSANIHGKPSATSDREFDQRVIDAVDIVVNAGDTPVAIESTIVDCTKETPKIVRQGALSAPTIEVICSERSN